MQGLTTQNYSFWCQTVEMYVCGREKLRHLTGELTPPVVTDAAAYHRWVTDDVVVKGWLISSLETRLRGTTSSTLLRKMYGKQSLQPIMMVGMRHIFMHFTDKTTRSNK
jgi:hypothetical protein